jgi:hypothetical protein
MTAELAINTIIIMARGVDKDKAASSRSNEVGEENGVIAKLASSITPSERIILEAAISPVHDRICTCSITRCAAG